MLPLVINTFSFSFLVFIMVLDKMRTAIVLIHNSSPILGLLRIFTALQYAAGLSHGKGVCLSQREL